VQSATVVQFGGPDVFRLLEQTDPVPGPGEVLIAVEVADVLWLETMVRSGAGQNYWPMRPPYVPGNGVAGRIITVGDQVDGGLVGRRVVAHTGNEGGYADRAVVPAEAVSLVPDNLSFAVAAALLHDAPTALALFDAVKIGADDTVLVVGASGGLGVLLVELARARAARVVAIARRAKLSGVRQLGPDAVVDSEQADWIDRARSALGAAGADVVLDNVGGDLGEASFGLVAEGGRFSGHGTPGGRFARIDERTADRLGVAVSGIEKVQMSAGDLKRYTEQALREASAGALHPVIGQTFPLVQAGAAHAAIESRTVFGKTLLTMTE
jgi:NADPH2:quinone reductase